MGIIIPLILITLACIIIWRAGDGFMLASEYIGRNLSDGVRGASINAIASSMPEVFTSLFFLFVLSDITNPTTTGIGFSGGIGTTAGSAVFNGMIIPAVSIITVISMGMVKRIEVSQKMMRRDGIALILTELIFLILISGSTLNWYHGLILMVVYIVYISYTFMSMNKSKSKKNSKESEENNEFETEPQGSFIMGLLTYDLERVFIRNKKIHNGNAWSLLIFSTISIAVVCYLLVIACNWMGADTYTVPYFGDFRGLNIPLMFVALILASIASSFPDTMISIKDAKNGNYDDAISNAFGSNIFDVCFALGFPLFLFTIFNGPIHMPPDLVNLSSELRFLLLILTIIVVLIFTMGKYIGKIKAFILIFLYILFVAYIVGRSVETEISNTVAEFLVSIVQMFSIR